MIALFAMQDFGYITVVLTLILEKYTHVLLFFPYF